METRKHDGPSEAASRTNALMDACLSQAMVI